KKKEAPADMAKAARPRPAKPSSMALEEGGAVYDPAKGAGGSRADDLSDGDLGTSGAAASRGYAPPPPAAAPATQVERAPSAGVGRAAAPAEEAEVSAPAGSRNVAPAAPVAAGEAFPEAKTSDAKSEKAQGDAATLAEGI